MLLPFVVSPLAIAADLEESLSASDWGAGGSSRARSRLSRSSTRLCAVVFAPVLRRTHESILEVLSRLLGILLAAVGVQLFLHGLRHSAYSTPRTDWGEVRVFVSAAG